MLPLEGVRVVEFAHMVMGPSCGLVLADLGAEVIKVEPLAGDNTRRLEAAGAGFFPVFNRNKKSLAVDLALPEGKEVALRLIASADVLTENFRPGALGRTAALLVRNRFVIGSVVMMAISFFAYMGLLTISDLSFAVPATAITYALETALAKYVLKEQVTWLRWTGALLVICGVALVSL